MSASTARGEYGRVFDGKSFRDVDPPPPQPSARRRWGRSSSSSRVVVAPVPPVASWGRGDGGDDPDAAAAAAATIFVSLPHFRDGRRCGRTLKRLFETARHPDRVTVGLIEQTDPGSPDDDPTCLREYCALVGRRDDARGGGEEDEEDGGGGGEGGESTARAGGDGATVRECPRASAQIRSVRFSHLHAKGPGYARSFVRKVLGNEG